ncbi:nitrite/sulfite reductase [Streptomyces sp. SID4919]|uniref:assimilatory sulfite reductase (ferredoxin) n=2 Tax=Streptomyces uncialis TaxID=1048205 RepID=A0A1Q4V6J1_9ACTN|nr:MULTISPECIES: nitrite/sulfite reductase [Streptomyces]MCX4659464.1 nitrite/sulfite reductase [Streptomyces uncialis]MYY07605.1 nitrite/sulfite reductase [Streptomyces sp. SID4919]OKH93456.1 sulfite reductase [Streptomyces uncialis]WST67548.1 nitrite/sulfite reductase [Streptomyces uncialis]WTE13765.1 nitrite/sulfite reductase [Streptomyces uncialis]
MVSTASTPPQKPAAAAPRRKVSRHRGEGQWAKGHYTPLNGNEQFKKDDDGLNVRTRIETIYSKAGFDSIDPNDLRGRMRWWGLYTQRKPGIDGGKTAILEPEELDDKYFMMRVRIDGGRLSTQQLRVIGEISQEFARGTADLTDRQNVQYHWIRIEDVPEIWRRLEAVGLSSTEACGDTPRVILGSPVAGIAEEEIIDGTPAIEEIYRRIVGNKDFSNLPRKFKSAVSGSPLLDVAHEINDIAFVGVEHPELGPGFDVWVGGGLSTNPKLGVRLGTWVSLDDVPDVYEGVISIFRDHGFRRLRTRARLKFLVADWGAEKFRQVLEDEYLLRKLHDGPAPEQPVERWRDHVGVHRQKDGRYYIGFAPRVGRVDGTILTKIAQLAEDHGSGRLRTTAEQKMIVLDITEDRVDSVVAALEALDLRVTPSPFRRGTMACTGIEYCKLAIVETKARAASLIDELERRLPEFEEPLTINLNGCPNACARIQVADIGLKGQLVLDDDGNQVEGYQVHLGGALGLEAGFGRKVRGLKVTSSELPDYVERVVRRFEAEREDGERFATWVTRASEEALS